MKKRNGVILIILAVLIFVGFLVFEFVDFSGDNDVSVSSEPTPTIIKNISIDVKNTIPPDGAEENRSEIRINVNKKILKLMKVSRKRFAEEIRIYANLSGYATADSVSDMGEVTINYELSKITFPCYFKVGKHQSNFDVVYWYDTKQWQFKPF